MASKKSKPRQCPFCDFRTGPLTLSEWRVAWESHRLSDDHKEKFKDKNVTVSAIKCQGEGCWEIIVIPWHPAKLKRYDKKTHTYHLVCRDPVCGHSNSVKSSSTDTLSLPLTTLWKTYPKECDRRFGPIEFRSSINRGRPKDSDKQASR